MTQITFALLQLDFIIGNPHQNALAIIAESKKAIEQGAQCIITPECAISGYLPEDLLLRHDHQAQVDTALQMIIDAKLATTLIVGHPAFTERGIMNRATVIQNGEVLTIYDKQCLPNYNVFDEHRYFQSGTHNTCITIEGVNIALAICEDIWIPTFIDHLLPLKPQLVIALNASPFTFNKYKRRLKLFEDIVSKTKAPLIYVNNVGGQDALVFDGGSVVMNEHGDLCAKAAFFKPETIIITLDFSAKPTAIPMLSNHEAMDDTALMVNAITLSIQDYAKKNHFTQGVLIGLSGGIDSALTLALAVRALGPDKVYAVYLPSRHNALMSGEDAQAQCKQLGVSYHAIDIEPIYESMLTQLEPLFHEHPSDVTEENIQARIRGNLLMALSNKKQLLLLTTGNKSEYAVGYATLYGDMCGGFAPIKDLYKTQVYAMSKWLNTIAPTIPERVITRAPSAELGPNQFDQDSLPPYDQLDTILEMFIEQDLSAEAIIKATGYPAAMVKEVLKKVARNEYKRNQSAPGPRMTSRAFGKDRRYPISSAFSSN